MTRFFFALACAGALAGGAATREAFSPFDDAAYWFRGGADANGNGILDSGSTEFTDVTHADDAAHAHHTMSLAQTDATKYAMPGAGSGTVVMPYAGRVLSSAPYLQLTQRFVTNGVVEVEATNNLVVTTNRYPYGTLRANYISLPDVFSNLPSGVACTNYTVFLRFRDWGRVCARQYEHNIFQFGFDWNAHCGTSLNVYHCGDYVLPKLYVGSDQLVVTDTAFRIPYGRWCDLAVSIEGKKATLAVCANRNEAGVVSNGLFAVTTLTSTSSVNTSAVSSSYRWRRRIGGEDAGISGVFTNGLAYTVGGKSGGTSDDPGINNKAKALWADIQSVAFWTRALTTNEIRQVFSERRPAVVQLGLANGSSSEFAKTNDTVDANGLHPESWNPILDATHTTLTVNFTVVDGEQGVAQYLRLRPIAGSAAASIVFALDGKTLEKRTVLPDRDTFVYVKADLLTQGAHTLTLTRTDALGGTFTVDALKLYGSWRIGDTFSSGGYGGMVHETNYPYQYVNPRRFPLTDGNMEHFARGLSGGNNGTHIIPFEMSDDLLRRARDAELVIDFNGGTITFDVFLNGATVKTGVPSNAGVQKMTVSTTMLQAGENTLTLVQKSGNWGNIKRYSLSLGCPVNGCVMIIR